MKHDHVCPKCKRREILYVKHVAEIADGGPPRWAHLAAQKRQIPGLFGLDSDQWSVSGKLEAYACRNCGYVEQYLIDPASVEVDGQSVSLLVGDAPGYRNA